MHHHLPRKSSKPSKPFHLREGRYLSNSIHALTKHCSTLVITKNYTGDALSFGLAIEKAKAAGLECKLLIVGDDVAIPHKAGSTVGRRGLAGVALVHKIAGAAAAEG